MLRCGSVMANTAPDDFCDSSAMAVFQRSKVNRRREKGIISNKQSQDPSYPVNWIKSGRVLQDNLAKVLGAKGGTYPTLVVPLSIRAGR